MQPSGGYYTWMGKYGKDTYMGLYYLRFPRIETSIIHPFLDLKNPEESMKRMYPSWQDTMTLTQRHALQIHIRSSNQQIQLYSEHINTTKG
jgi:oligoribonuclease (3'-5' exoribonuclease)